MQYLCNGVASQSQSTVHIAICEGKKIIFLLNFELLWKYPHFMSEVSEWGKIKLTHFRQFFNRQYPTKNQKKSLVHTTKIFKLSKYDVLFYDYLNNVTYFERN